MGVSLNKRQNGKCLGYGHIYVANMEEARKIIDLPHTLMDRLLFLDVSEDKEQIKAQSSGVKQRIVVASRVPAAFNEDILKQYFK